MIYIAHRGNINGKNPNMENYPDYITEAIKRGFNVEIDVWYINNEFFLGHDSPNTPIPESFLLDKNLWIHAKNIEALYQLHEKTNCFFHNTDDAVLTSRNFIWTYPGKKLMPNSIAVLPEPLDYNFNDIINCYGICTDDVLQWKK
jgi:hypothetical protein